MNDKNPKLTDETGNKKNPFKVPEGYFENLNQQIMSQLESPAQESPGKVGLWEKAKPWMYLAAMFVGVALLFTVFHKKTATTDDHYAKAIQTEMMDSFFVEEEDIDDLYDYLEAQVITQNYREAVFIGE